MPFILLCSYEIPFVRLKMLWRLALQDLYEGDTDSKCNDVVKNLGRLVGVGYMNELLELVLTSQATWQKVLVVILTFLYFFLILNFWDKDYKKVGICCFTEYLQPVKTNAWGKLWEVEQV